MLMKLQEKPNLQRQLAEGNDFTALIPALDFEISFGRPFSPLSSDFHIRRTVCNKVLDCIVTFRRAQPEKVQEFSERFRV